MQSSLPKVLHPVAGQSLLAHVLAPLRKAASLAGRRDRTGPQGGRRGSQTRPPRAASFVQRERLGTAHAVLRRATRLPRGADDLLVVFGDTPLIFGRNVFAAARAAAVRRGAGRARLSRRGSRPAMAGCWSKATSFDDPRGQADATPAQRAITLCNAGVMAFDGARRCRSSSDRQCQRQGRILSDRRRHRGSGTWSVAVVIETTEDEVRGINTKAQLAEAEDVMQTQLRQAALEAGVTLIAPETVFFAADTTFGKDVTIEPYVVFGPGVRSTTARRSMRSRTS